MSEFLVAKQVSIEASPAAVWLALTDPLHMPKWMSETEMEVQTDWTIGSDITIQGRWHKMKYKNTGKVIQFEPYRILSYSHLSSLSRLPDLPENHNVLTFTLHPEVSTTILYLKITNSVTYEIYKHLDFYWNVTLTELKRFAESLT